MKVKILSDSGADTGKWNKENLVTLPLSIRFDETEYKDNVDLSHHDFYEKLIESDSLPQTSQIPPFIFEEAYKENLKDADALIVITLSSKLSGTNQSANLAAADYENVYVIDSENAACGQKTLVKLALELVDKDLSVKEIVDILNEKKKDIHLIALLDTLEYLKKGGRISSAVAMAGSMLKIKPVIGIIDGEVQMIGKARGSKKGNNLLIEEVNKAGGIDFDLPYSLGYTGLDTSLIEKYIADSKEILGYPEIQVPYESVGGAIGTHAGPGAIALAFFAKKQSAKD